MSKLCDHKPILNYFSTFITNNSFDYMQRDMSPVSNSGGYYLGTLSCGQVQELDLIGRAPA